MREIIQLVRDRGLVILPQVSAAEFQDAMLRLGPVYRHPDSNPDGQTLISPSGRRGELGSGFTMQALPAHTDRSSLPDPPRYLGMRLERHDASMGGSPLFADLDLVRTGLPQEAIESLSIETLIDGNYLPILLEQSRGLRYRDDAHGRLAGPQELVTEFRRRIAQVTQVVDWLSSGDAYIIDNHRMAHGRTATTNPDRIGMRILTKKPVPQAVSAASRAMKRSVRGY